MKIVEASKAEENDKLLKRARDDSDVVLEKSRHDFISVPAK